jgi:multidrug efflux system outer membrane protein
MNRRSALLMLAATASGCAGPRPAQPPAARIAVPAGWRTPLAPGRAIESDWWRSFGDPALAAVVEAALAANLDLAIAAARVVEARAQERLARAQMGPELDLGASAAYARTVNPFGQPSTATAAQPAAQVSWDLDLFGRLARADAAARAQILSTQAARDAVALSVAASAATGYIALRGLDARLEIAQRTVSDRTESVRLARRRAETGYTSDLELRQAEAELHAAEQLAPQLQLGVSRQENALRALTGLPPGTVTRGLPLDRLIPPAIPDGLPSDLLRRRPDLYQAEEALVAADRSLDSARAAFMPNVRLTGSAGLALSTALADPIGLWSIGGSILAPLFDSGRLRAQADAAAARRDQAALAYGRAVLNALREVDDSLAGVQRSGEQAAAIAAQRDALARGQLIAANRYRAGYSSYIEQLDAQRGLLAAELALVQATADRLTAFATLYQALGGGWTVTQVGRFARPSP